MMCPLAWFLLAVIFVFSIPMYWAWREMKRETKLAQQIRDREEGILARAGARLDRADETRAKARKEFYKWKFANITADASKFKPLPEEDDLK